MTVLFWYIYFTNFTYYWMRELTLCTSLKLEKKRSLKTFIPSLQRRSPSITRCTSFTFFSKRSWVFKTFSRIPQTLLTVQRSWLDTFCCVPWTFTTRNAHTARTTKYRMFSAHKLCIRMTMNVMKIADNHAFLSLTLRHRKLFYWTLFSNQMLAPVLYAAKRAKTFAETTGVPNLRFEKSIE